MFTCPDGYIVGDTIHFPFDTYDSNGASVTITGLAVTDIEVYKNGSVTQRASDNGYALLDTDGIDFDGATGLHGFSIDTSDNSDAGFWVDGTYFINVNAITVDAQTVRLTYWLKLGPVKANVTQFGGVNATTSGGRPEVNASHWAGAATATNDVALATAPTNFASLAITAAGGVTLADGVTHGGSTADFEARDISVAGTTNFVGAFVADNAGNQIKGIDSFTTAGKAELQAEANDAIVANRLDELLAADSDIDGAAPPTVGSVFHELMSKTAGSFTFDQATDSLEAVRDRGDAAWITATGFSTLDAAGVRTAVGLAAANLDTQLALLATAAALATVDTVVDAIKVVTDALTAAAAANLALSAGTMLPGTVDNTAHTPTTTEFEADDITEATADHFNGRVIIFTSGALQYQATTISDYALVGGRGHFTVVALTEAPANNATFIII